MKHNKKSKSAALVLLSALLMPAALQAAAPGNALSFDGADDYVSIADANDLDLTNNYTLECWFKADSFGTGGVPWNLRGLISKYQSPAADGYFLRFRGTELDFDGTVTAGLNLQTGTWYHVAAVNDNGIRHLYLNGVDKTSLLTGSSIAVQANTNALTLASDYLSDNNRFFDGRMDEVRVWNDVRTVTEINDNRNKELVGNESGLVAYYSCNETSGTSLPDVTVPSKNHTGTLMNGPAWVISTIFGGVTTATVTATASGTGSGSVSSNIGGISYSYPPTGTGTTTAIEYGNEVVLTATAAAGSSVTWTATGGTIGGTTTSATCTFSNLNGNKTAAATFTLIPAVDLYVDRAATGANNGTSWANAFTNLQSALAGTSKGTIYIARGTYKPTAGADRTATFQLKNNVTLQGGYPTGGGTRDPKTHVTILSGDLLGNDNGNMMTDNGTDPTLSDNSYTVVTGSGTDGTTILDGFTISGGNADNWDTSGWHGPNGAGMYNDNGSPTVRNVTFANNMASRGAGMYNTGSAPGVTGVTFSNNYASAGAGMYNLASSPALRNVTFSNNSTNDHGAGMYNTYGSSPSLTNVTFSGNSAGLGGGIMNEGSDNNPVLMNVTFSNNSANSGGGMYNNGNTPTLTNCILWGNSPDQFLNASGSTPAVTYSVVQGGHTGTGNLSADPLLGPLGNYGGYTQTIPLLTGSPAINAATATGAPATDQRGTARPKGTGYDIGAFELDTTAASPPTVTSIVAASAFPVASINVTINGTNFSGAPAVLIRKTGFATITATNVTLVNSARLTCTLDIYGAVAGPRDVAVINPDGRNCALTNGFTVLDVPRGNVYVDKNRSGGNHDGTSWANAFTDLAGILPSARSGDTIHVAQGTYKPTPAADRTKTFVLNDGVTLLGGYPTGGAGSRDPKTYPAILTGDLLGNDNNVIAHDEATRAENTYSVITRSGAYGNSATLDGFTITGGNANGNSDDGGGLCNYSNANLTLANVTFRNNSASDCGGGLYNESDGTLAMTNVTFSNNSADYGGGLYTYYSTNSLTNVTFSGNSAYQGGGLHTYSGTSTLTNVTVSGNSASYSGGGIFLDYTTLTMSNSMVWGNSPDGIHDYDDDSTITVTYSVVQGNLYSGTGNLNADPFLGPLGDFGGYTQTIPLLPGSPAIDAGTATGAPTTDQRGIARPQGAGYDIGAFERDSTTAPQPTVTSITPASAARSAALSVTIHGTNFSGTPVVLLQKGGNANIVATNLALVNSGSLTCTFNTLGVSAGTWNVVVLNQNGRSGALSNGFKIPHVNVYVDRNNPGGTHNGTSWATAFLDLAAVVASSQKGDIIHVARGTYKPTSDTDRTKTFQLKSGVSLLGGYPTGGGTRDSKANVTILSGDIGTSADNSDNSFNVVTASGTDGTASLEGFTISGGNASGDGDGGYEDGGGMYNDDGSPTLNEVTFSGNTAKDYGGGLYNESGSPALTDVTFSNNTALSSDGGGMYSNGGNPTLRNVTFSGNSAYDGGGIYTSSGNPTLRNVTFSGNTAVRSGGGMYSDEGATLTNVTFSGNSAADGGGMYNYGSLMLMNVTISGNSATNSGGGIYNYSNSLTLTNTILWGNSPDGIHDDSSEGEPFTATVSYSVVQGGYAGTANLSTDPKLGTLGDNGGPTQTIPLLAGSPAINAGTATGAPSSDQRGVERPRAGGYDIGAFEADSLTTHTLTATADAHGAIAPAGTVAVAHGGTQNFSITPATYYHVADVTKNSVSVGAVTAYSWTNVTADGTIHATFAPDLAANGTPHWWLAQYGWTSNFDAAEAADSDGDGQSAGQEYQADTNPTDSGSVFRVTGFARSPAVAVTFASSANRLYTLYRSTDLAAASWLPVAGQLDVPGTGGPLTLRDNSSPQPPHCFYRVGVRVP